MLDLSRVPDIEYSALQTLMEDERRMTDSGTVVWLAGLNPGVVETVQHAGLAERLGRERMLFNARAAIERYQALQKAAGRGDAATRSVLIRGVASPAVARRVAGGRTASGSLATSLPVGRADAGGRCEPPGRRGRARR